jgi:hypothetical protein
MIFPVKVPYTISADITKYIGQVFNPAPSEEYILQKKLEFNQYGDEPIKHSLTAVKYL